jgi:hypothetical protein
MAPQRNDLKELQSAWTMGDTYINLRHDCDCWMIEALLHIVLPNGAAIVCLDSAPDNNQSR